MKRPRPKKRYLKKIPPKNPVEWNCQMYNLRVYNELVYNTDPNVGDFLITRDWKLWMVDFSRAFRVHKKLRNPRNLGKIDPRVLEGLRKLDRSTLTESVGGFLTMAEIEGLLARRDLVVKLFDRQITDKGELLVFARLPER